MKIIRKSSFVIIFLLFLPFLCLATNTVIINEIAWMGTVESSNNEWIELYNNSDSPINIKDWSIYGADTEECLNFSDADGNTTTTISKYEYLIYANNENSIKNINGINIVDIWDKTIGLNDKFPGQIILYNSPNCQGDIIDNINQTDKEWLNGNSQTKQTMERIETDWQTSQDVGGTPKSANSSGASEDGQVTEDGQDIESAPATEIPFLPSTDYPPVAEAGPDIIALNNQEIVFDALQSYDPDADKLNFFWNFGDGATDTKATTTHIYTIPGQYIATLQVSDKKFSAFDNLTVNVYNQSIIISEFKNEWIEIYNQSGQVANLSGWQLDNQEDENKPFVFPDNSLIAPYQFLVLKQLITKISLSNQDTIRLIYPSGQIASQINYANIKENQSIASDGINYYATDVPTPGAVNIISNRGIATMGNLSANNPKPPISESQEPQISVNNLTEAEDFSALSLSDKSENNNPLAIQTQNISNKVKPLSNNLLLNPQSVPKKSSANLILILSIIISASLLIGWGMIMIKKHML